MKQTDELEEIKDIVEENIIPDVETTTLNGRDYRPKIVNRMQMIKELHALIAECEREAVEKFWKYQYKWFISNPDEEYELGQQQGVLKEYLSQTREEEMKE